MKVITVGNNKGGVGKTMCSFQLVCHLANLGHRVLVIDLDSQANLSSLVPGDYMSTGGNNCLFSVK